MPVETGVRRKLTVSVGFPQEYPAIVAGALSFADDTLITGHSNGLVVRSDLRTGKKSVLHQCSPTIRSISISPRREVAVGTSSGLLMTLPLDHLGRKSVLREEDFSTNSRVWKTIWPTENTIVISSTYGELSAYNHHGDKWDREALRGHRDSIFGLGTSEDAKLMASGDYKGNIIVWGHEKGEYEKLDDLTVQGSIEDISWRGDGSFAAINSSGHVYFFEPKLGSSQKQWELVLETDTATGAGECVHLTGDSKSLFAGTISDLIQLDLDSQNVQQEELGSVLRIFSRDHRVFVLTSNGLLTFERIDVQAPLSLVKYQFAKVSLIGHTGVGKTTLCSLIVKGSARDIKSTFGRRVWDWRLDDGAGSMERRILLHDHGGQETVLSTFLPFVSDSEVILLFFKQNDLSTLTKALSSLDLLTPMVSSRTKMFFVETYIDQPINEIDESFVKRLVDERKLRGWEKVSPLTGEGVENLKKLLVSEVSWQNARVVMRSAYVEAVTQTISDFEDEHGKVVSFQEFKKRYEKTSHQPISSHHLRFLLGGFASQGLVEYYPQVLDAIIFNDETYNRLKTNIPIFVEKRNGLIRFKELQDAFTNHEYLHIIDEIYLKYGIAIRNHDLRIFPTRLRNGPIEVPAEYKTQLAESSLIEMRFASGRFDVGRLAAGLSEMDLSCLDISQSDGLFAWDKNACVYYTIQEMGDAISGRYVRFTFRVGGSKESMRSRLQDELGTIVEALYGPSLDSPLKKKVARQTKFDVALSFAGEQRGYVEAVASLLTREGLRVFYDQFYQSQIWGKSLPEYLQEVYYSQSKWCIMFISKNYVEKMYPVHERKSAIARHVKDLGGYILPVRFDSSEVPGLDPGLAYQDANKKSPQEIASLFLRKFSENAPNTGSE